MPPHRFRVFAAFALIAICAATSGRAQTSTATVRKAPNPADVKSVDAIVGTYYVALAAPRGAPTNWDRLRSLFLPDARLVTTVVLPNSTTTLRRTSIDEFIRSADSLAAIGYRAREIKRVEERFGAVAQVFSTYESYREGDARPFARGINGMQLFNDGSRWWIVSVAGDLERAGVTIQPEYLPEPEDQPVGPAQTGVAQVVVANQESASASIIEVGGQPRVRNIEVGAGPHEVAISPDGRKAVVTLYGTRTQGKALAVIDLANARVEKTIDLGVYTRPHGVVFLGDNDRVAVTSEATRNVLVVTLSNGAVRPIATNARGSHMVAVNARGTTAWTANMRDSTVTEIDLVSGRQIRSYSVPAIPEGIAVTPDGGEVWVGSNTTGAVSVISPSTGKIVHTIKGAEFPYRLAASPDGRLMAVVDGRGNKLLIAEVGTYQYTGSIEMPEPRGVTIASDSRTAFVTLGGGNLAIVDLVTRKVLQTEKVQLSPDGVAGKLR